MARLAIQVILYQSENKLETLKASLDAQTFRDFEVYYRDNSIEKNIGFAGGHADLYKQHQSPFVLLLNDDAKLAPDYIERVMQAIDSNELIASVTGLVYRDDGATVDTTGLEYKCLGSIIDRKTVPVSGEVFGVSGAVGLYRRSALEKAGGLFDPSWFMYKEDADLAIRLRRAGYIAWFESTAIAWHTRGLKDQSGGWLARLQNECKRPWRLRKSSYQNQWRLYRRYWSTISWEDRCCTIRAELMRTGLFFLAALCSQR